MHWLQCWLYSSLKTLTSNLQMINFYIYSCNMFLQRNKNSTKKGRGKICIVPSVLWFKGILQILKCTEITPKLVGSTVYHRNNEPMPFKQLYYGEWVWKVYFSTPAYPHLYFPPNTDRRQPKSWNYKQSQKGNILNTGTIGEVKGKLDSFYSEFTIIEEHQVPKCAND